MVEVWSAPVLTEDLLRPYRPVKAVKAVKGSNYGIGDHRHLAEGSASRQLFETLRKQVLALDPCVTEQFLKLYVAFKADTNFVDVVPQANRLLLSINLDFHELQDPRSLARDVTNLGRWGNGKAEVSFESEQQISYVMGLVRQAFEKQMGNGEVES